MNKNINFVDLFSGAGGLTLGFQNKGFQNIFSVDFDKSSAQTYLENFPKHNLVVQDIKKLKKENILQFIGNDSIDIVAGGPPCQGFSIAGNIGRKFIDDERNYLFKEFIRVTKIIDPTYVVMENVERLYSNKRFRNEIIKSLEKIGFNVACKVLNAVDFRIPQKRRRVFFIGSKKNKEIIFPYKSANKEKSVQEAIDDLPRLDNGMRSNIINHESMKHTEQMLKKMSFIPDGGDRSFIPIKIRPKSGDVRKYIRYASSKPSICITGDMRKVFHYNQNRALTVRELARIQTFPDNFIFKGSKISQQQQIGNAVPPLLAEKIAECIIEMNNDAS